jgi:hypothetical protein
VLFLNDVVSCHCINFFMFVIGQETVEEGTSLLSYLGTVYTSVGHPDPDVFEPPGSGSMSQRSGSRSFTFLIKMD